MWVWGPRICPCVTSNFCHRCVNRLWATSDPVTFSLKTELQNATEEIRQKSLKKEYKEKGIIDSNDILDDDLTIIGIGK